MTLRLFGKAESAHKPINGGFCGRDMLSHHLSKMVYQLLHNQIIHRNQKKKIIYITCMD